MKLSGKFLAIAAAAVIVVGGGAVALAITQSAGSPSVARAGIPCVNEDSNGCDWDASKQGNGIGRSFTADKHGNVTYWDGRP